LVKRIENEKIPLILVEIYYPERPLRFLREATGIRTLRLPLILGGVEGQTNLLGNLEFMADEIAKALSG
jgi:hypothetical protein